MNEKIQDLEMTIARLNSDLKNIEFEIKLCDEILNTQSDITKAWKATASISFVISIVVIMVITTTELTDLILIPFISSVILLNFFIVFKLIQSQLKWDTRSKKGLAVNEKFKVHDVLKNLNFELEGSRKKKHEEDNKKYEKEIKQLTEVLVSSMDQYLIKVRESFQGEITVSETDLIDPFVFLRQEYSPNAMLGDLQILKQSGSFDLAARVKAICPEPSFKGMEASSRVTLPLTVNEITLESPKILNVQEALTEYGKFLFGDRHWSQSTYNYAEKIAKRNHKQNLNPNWLSLDGQEKINSSSFKGKTEKLKEKIWAVERKYIDVHMSLVADYAKKIASLKQDAKNIESSIKSKWQAFNLSAADKFYMKGKSSNIDEIIEYISTYLSVVLPLPNWIHKKFEVTCDYQAGILLIDLGLPQVEKISIFKDETLKNGENKAANKMERRKFLEDVNYAYSIVIGQAVAKLECTKDFNLICINGIKTYTCPQTGHQKSECVLTYAAEKEKLLELNIAGIEPEKCFKGLRGLSVGNFSEVIPVQPIYKFNKEENKFVEGRNVLHKQEGMNLAAMDWQDFEHLVREILAKEYQGEGEEVKVTQSSRDGGIDAVIFDPDPIKGGKIIVQAKRYTNLVDVSFVRDLYGTLVNEGAMKGILITTSTFGHDSIEFANSKPISLINGSELLFLLEKHGYKARIDLIEAKRILKEAEQYASS